jgi:outer membrane biosynthesis protein TonB
MTKNQSPMRASSTSSYLRRRTPTAVLTAALAVASMSAISAFSTPSGHVGSSSGVAATQVAYTKSASYRSHAGRHWHPRPPKATRPPVTTPPPTTPPVTPPATTPPPTKPPVTTPPPTKPPVTTPPPTKPPVTTPPPTKPPVTTPPPTTPPPTTTPAAGSADAAAQLGASNTGIAGHGMTASQLTTSGATTFGPSYNGQTVSGRRFTGTVIITASNFTLKDCVVNPPGGDGTMGIHVYGANVTIDHCTVAPSSSWLFEGALLEPGANGTTITGSDISGAENNISFYQTGAARIIGNYLHDPRSSVSGAHVDNIEVYSGAGSTIAGNRLVSPASSDVVSEINIAPWGGRSVNNLTISDNFIDGAHYHILHDPRQGNGITNVRILRNYFGGHNDIGGQYLALLNYSAPIVQSESALSAQPNGILWPNTGADVNRWKLSTGLSPDRSGQIVTE